MNSRLEYNHCYIPKIHMKTGNSEDKSDEDIEKEKSTKEKIKMLYKSERKREKPDEKEDKKFVAAKKMRIELTDAEDMPENY